MTTTDSQLSGITTRKLIGAALVVILAIYAALNPDAERDATRQGAAQRSQAASTVADNSSVTSESSASLQATASVAKNDHNGESHDAQAVVLQDIGGNVKVSPAGLKYGPGSQEGHRLDHVLRHDNNQADRPGKHGVFDGDQNELLKVIDEAWTLVKQGDSAVQTSHEGRRDIHDVDLKRRVGFIGGQAGRQRGEPAATHVRLIVEGDFVISAYPY